MLMRCHKYIKEPTTKTKTLQKMIRRCEEKECPLCKSIQKLSAPSK